MDNRRNSIISKLAGTLMSQKIFKTAESESDPPPAIKEEANMMSSQKSVGLLPPLSQKNLASTLPPIISKTSSGETPNLSENKVVDFKALLREGFRKAFINKNSSKGSFVAPVAQEPPKP